MPFNFWGLPNSSREEGWRIQTHHRGMHTLLPCRQGSMQYGVARQVLLPCSLTACVVSKAFAYIQSGIFALTTILID